MKCLLSLPVSKLERELQSYCQLFKEFFWFLSLGNSSFEESKRIP